MAFDSSRKRAFKSNLQQQTYNCSANKTNPATLDLYFPAKILGFPKIKRDYLSLAEGTGSIIYDLTYINSIYRSCVPIVSTVFLSTAFQDICTPIGKSMYIPIMKGN